MEIGIVSKNEKWKNRAWNERSEKYDSTSQQSTNEGRNTAEHSEVRSGNITKMMSLKGTSSNDRLMLMTQAELLEKKDKSSHDKQIKTRAPTNKSICWNVLRRIPHGGVSCARTAPNKRKGYSKIFFFWSFLRIMFLHSSPKASLDSSESLSPLSFSSVSGSMDNTRIISSTTPPQTKRGGMDVIKLRGRFEETHAVSKKSLRGGMRCGLDLDFLFLLLPS